MPHDTPLIGTIVVALVAAFLMGALAHRLRISPIAGYLLAGVIVGPFTPGFVAHSGLASELAEIGIILLMFGVGLHFSMRDLLSVKNIAVPGAVVQIAVATVMGMGLAWWMGWTPITGVIFGLALSVASTVVLLRALQGEDLLRTERGRIAIGWLIVEDLAMVLALVLLPVIAEFASGTGDYNGGAILITLFLTFAKVAAFIALMLLVGKRLIPAVLHWVVHTGSRELFRVAVLAIALGVAFGAAYLFDVSFALGAFFAGLILGETQLSKRAAEETLPLRDAFAVLFFVSVGMLFDPAVVIEQPLPLIATVAIIIIGKSLAAFTIVRLFGHPSATALTISASLAQIGEFSFILAGLGTHLGVMPSEARDLILAGAIFSILANPFIFGALAKRLPKDTAAEPVPAPPKPDAIDGHIIVIGYGRVGSVVARELRSIGLPVVVIEDQEHVAQRADDDGIRVVIGNAAQAKTLVEAGIDKAGKLLIAVPEGFEAGAIAQHAKALNPTLPIVARAHSIDEAQHLVKFGADEIVMGEQVIANRMVAIAAPLRMPVHA